VFAAAIVMWTAGRASGQMMGRPGPATAPPAPPPGQEFEIAAAGLRIRDIPYQRPAARPGYAPSYMLIARVEAVQEKGPAWVAGMAPGDLIFRVGSTSSVNARSIFNLASTRYQRGSEMGVSVYYRYAGSGAPKCVSPLPGTCTKEMTILMGDPGSGTWVAAVPVHDGPNESPWPGRRALPGFTESHESAKQQYTDLRKRDLQLVGSKGCKTTPQEVEQMAGELKMAAAAAGLTGQGDQVILSNSRASACENAKGGGLSSFEGALYAMTDARRLNPCTYDPAADYSNVLNDPEYAQFQNARSYNSGAIRRLEIYLDRAAPAQRACFLDLIQATLTGRPWKPAASGQR
jgi:hypothetical protein